MLIGLLRHRASLVGLVGLCLYVLLAVVAPLVKPDAAFELDLQARLSGPSLTHLFGTDELGRDLFARVVYGGRVSLETAAGAVAIAASVGVPFGLLAGLVSGWREAVVMRFMDMVLAIPAVLLAMVIIAIIGAGTLSAMIAVGVVSIPAFARVVRASTLALKEQEYVLASRAVGARDLRIALRTILPNAWGPIIVQLAVTAATALLLEAALDFLGLGTAPPEPSWGSLLSSAQDYIFQTPWYGIFPGIAVTGAVLCFDGIASGLQATIGGAGSRRDAGRPALGRSA